MIFLIVLAAKNNKLKGLKMKNKLYKSMVLVTSVAITTLSGCGGSSNSDGESPDSLSPSDAVGWLLPVDEVTRQITLKEQENVIYGRGCTTQKFYNSTGEFVGGRNFYDGYSLKNTLPSGNYTVSVSEIYSDTYDSNGVLYFLSSGYAVENLIFGQSYEISDISVKLLKFNLNESRTVVSNSYGATVYLYDSELNSVSFSNNSPKVLPAGEYYFLGSHDGINACRYDKPGLFSLIDLGIAS